MEREREREREKKRDLFVMIASNKRIMTRDGKS